jgi:hypothetical protein
MISGRARSGRSGRRASPSRGWPRKLGINEGTLGKWVNADKRRRGEGDGNWIPMNGKIYYSY